MKTCNKCLVYLDDSLFSKHSGANYLRPECKRCNYKLAKERKLLKDKHDYPEKGYSCPICLKDESSLTGVGGKASVWVLDHDHATGNFRGYICHNCNRALGCFGDNVERIKRAIAYIESTSTGPMQEGESSMAAETAVMALFSADFQDWVV